MEPIRIAPTPPLVLNEFSARNLREKPTRDVVNAREYLRWNADIPYQSARTDNAPVFYDMAPLSSRSQDRSVFMQAQPFVVDAPPFQDNPYFTKYDITSDPRNIVRELRTAVVENNFEKGDAESAKMYSRGFDSRFIPVTNEDTLKKKALDDYEFLKPKMDDFKTDFHKKSNQNSNQNSK
jgi:hypothetical protein